MENDERSSFLSKIIGDKEPQTFPAYARAGAAWQAYEQGMDWDAYYLESMGNLDFDTEEFEAFLSALAHMRVALSGGANIPADLARRAREALDAYDAFSTASWDVLALAGGAERLARPISEALGVPFVGRHGGGSTNNPL